MNRLCTQAHAVDDQDPMFQRHEAEIDELNTGPQEEIVHIRSLIGFSKLLHWVAALKHRHRGQEDEHVDRSEDELVASNAG